MGHITAEKSSLSHFVLINARDRIHVTNAVYFFPISGRFAPEIQLRMSVRHTGKIRTLWFGLHGRLGLESLILHCRHKFVVFDVRGTTQSKRTVAIYENRGKIIEVPENVESP